MVQSAPAANRLRPVTAGQASAAEAVPIWTTVELDKPTFLRLVALVGQSCGISLSEHKRTMLETRLRRRLLINEISSFSDYADFLATPEGRQHELQSFIDTVVTNETSFFREKPHFDYLTPTELSRLANSASDGRLKMWSAASSSGEEAYTLAMIADDASRGGLDWKWSILATDISIKILIAARAAVYLFNGATNVPEHLRKKYFLPAPDVGAGAIRLSPDIRRNISFGQLNLMHAEYRMKYKMDIIFLRNVLIYFEPEVQMQIIRKLCLHLRPGGLMFLGHSDALRSRDIPLSLIRNNIYERQKD